MALAKKSVKPKLAKKAPAPQAIQVLRTATVPVKQLQMFHRNPNVGDIDAVAESIKENGQFRAIVVNVGTFTGRKNEILAGNHTYLATRRLGRSDILASFVDVDDDQATKIVLADNKTAKLATLDDKIIAELFANLDTTIGTGYTELEVSSIMKDAEETARNVLTGLEEEEAEERERERGESFEGTGLGDEDVEEDFDDSPSPGNTSIEKQDEDLPGLAELKELLPEDEKMRTGYWGLPALRKDMLVLPSEIPTNLESWAGSACKDWPDDEQWWLYNWGVDSTSGMKDVSKVIISFYCWDDYFENWFWTPKRYMSKLLNSRIKMMVTPNYSMWSNVSRTMNLWALYRSRYVGRYAQEAGIKIIPDLIWPTGDPEFLEKLVLPTLPRNLPMLSHQLQTNSDQLISGDGEEISAKQYKDEFQIALDTAKPQALLFYSTKHGLDWFSKNIKYSGKVIYVETRMRKLAESRKNKERKATI